MYNRRVSYCQVRRCAAAFDLSQGCLICPTFALTLLYFVSSTRSPNGRFEGLGTQPQATKETAAKGPSAFLAVTLLENLRCRYLFSVDSVTGNFDNSRDLMCACEAI